MFKLGNTSVTIKDFAQYVATAQGFYQRVVPFSSMLREMYKDFEMSKILDFEKSRLEEEYPDFRYLVQEYHDGILLFNLMEEKIWTAAAKDTIGLENYYNSHKDTYKWGERLNALVVTSPDQNLLKEAYKLANDYYAGKLSKKDILSKVCKDSLKTCLNVTDTLFEKGDNLILDSIGWSLGVSQIVNKDGKYGFFVKKSLKAPEVKAFADVKGVCIADYQVELENKYLSDLRKKYTIVVNNELLKSLK
jgi:peptidyl-prolyl cis-trans isomerase SurA